MESRGEKGCTLLYGPLPTNPVSDTDLAFINTCLTTTIPLCPAYRVSLVKLSNILRLIP